MLAWIFPFAVCASLLIACTTEANLPYSKGAEQGRSPCAGVVEDPPYAATMAQTYAAHESRPGFALAKLVSGYTRWVSEPPRRSPGTPKVWMNAAARRPISDCAVWLAEQTLPDRQFRVRTAQTLLRFAWDRDVRNLNRGHADADTFVVSASLRAAGQVIFLDEEDVKALTDASDSFLQRYAISFLSPQQLLAMEQVLPSTSYAGRSNFVFDSAIVVPEGYLAITRGLVSPHVPKDPSWPSRVDGAVVHTSPRPWEPFGENPNTTSPRKTGAAWPSLSERRGRVVRVVRLRVSGPSCAPSAHNP